MKLTWYINRLRSMRPAEILHRVGEKGRKTRSRQDRRGWSAPVPGPLKTVFPDLRGAVATSSPARRVAIAHAAERALSGQFSGLGVSWPQRAETDLFPAELWSLDPVTGGAWPAGDTYTFDVDYRHNSTRGDIKYVWEIGRLQQLPVLAAHAVLVDDARAILAIEAAISSWHAANPPFNGVGWASGIEVALRAISLIVTRDLVGDRLSGETEARIAAILAASAYWLARFPSKYSSANNHLIAELTGEYLIAIAIGAPEAPLRKALAQEAGLQILADGAPAEQSPTYGAFTAELILFAMRAARGQGQSFGSLAQSRLSAFAGFIDWLPPGCSFGDDDEGRAVTLGDETDYPRSVAAAIRGFLGEAGQPAPADDFRALIFGEPATATAANEGLMTFSQGGISVWRGTLAGRSADITFDHGPLGYLAIAAHGHADALSMALWLDGLPVLVDPGTWLYGSGGIWRNWFRSTPAHNTLSIAGESQSIMSGAFNWSHKAKARLVERRSSQDWSLMAEHDGYRRRFGTIHQRTIERQGNEIVIADALPERGQTAEIVFQLAGGLVAEQAGMEVHVRRNGVLLLSIAFATDDITIASGGEIPGDGGWVSPRFGQKTPAPRVVWRGHVGAEPVQTAIRIAAS